MPDNPEIFRPMTNLKHFEQMTDIYGVPCDVHLVCTFRDGRSLGVGYDLRQPAAFFVYDRGADSGKWHKHCGPYATFDQASEWIRCIREGGAVVGSE